ncbi:outer membrane beta-barrel protein [Anderseniella sp. Alg231-50]|uniref:outer membrane beta-barrel protein n=1 Tax=Anderseniella sp. Alg231-50 TaxID=1922226 RepID=UPI000D559626
MSGQLKTAALGLSLLAMGSVSAVADDAYMSPLGDWNGFYVGGHAGYINAKTSGDEFELFDFDNREFDSGSSGGGIFGAQIGYNIQAGEFLIGIEADGSFVDVSAVELDLKDTYSADYDWFATVRGRAGLILNENTLIYATGGLAFSELDLGEDGSFDMTGFVLGGGVEHMFTAQWSAKVEYLYANFGEVEGPFEFDTLTQADFQPEFHIIRAGVNFHF